MSQRKIITIGSSYAVTLPKTWVKHNKLKKGSPLTYDIQKDQTIIYTPFRDTKHQNELTLLITEHNMDSIIRGIIAGFLNGYKTIRLNSQTYLSADQQKTMREIASRFYMMIIKSDSRGITLQTIVDEENASIISIIERMHIITYSMCKDILASIQTPDKELLRGLINLENDIDQMKFLLSRLIRMSVSNPFLAAKQSIDTLDCIDYQILVNRIERVADHLTNISKNLLEIYENGKKVPKEIVNVYLDAADKAFSNYEKAIRSCIEKDLTNIDDVIKKEEEIVTQFYSITPLPEKISHDDLNIVVNLIQLRESIRKISHYSADIAEITIDQTYKNKNY